MRARRGSGAAGEKSWQVTAVDFSATALDFGRARAQAAGAEVAARLEWVDGDLGSWVPPAQEFDLVVSLYVHLDGDVGEALGRVARGVAPGGRFVLVGHQPIDPDTGQPTPAAGQRQVSLADVDETFDSAQWRIDLAQERRRPDPTSGVDAVVVMTRLD